MGTHPKVDLFPEQTIFVHQFRPVLKTTILNSSILNSAMLKRQVVLVATIFLHVLEDPVFEECGARKHGVRFGGLASWGSMTDITVQLPSSVDFAHKWAATITMATRDGVHSTLSGADHARSDWNADGLLVLCFADFIVHNWHDCLLEEVMHASRVLDLAPTCEHAFGARWQRSGRQASRLNIFAEDSWSSELEQGDVVVQISGVPLWVGDHSLHIDVILRAFSVVPVVFTNSNLEYVWSVDRSIDTMCGRHNPSW